MNAPALDRGVRIEPFFGHIRMETRMRPEGNRIIGEGRSWHYDGEGNLTKDTGWQPTGAVLIWPDEKPRRRFDALIRLLKRCL